MFLLLNCGVPLCFIVWAVLDKYSTFGYCQLGYRRSESCLMSLIMLILLAGCVVLNMIATWHESTEEDHLSVSMGWSLMCLWVCVVVYRSIGK